MINYEQGEVNTVIVTLTERVTISDPFFLLEVISKATGDVVKTFVTDTSAYEGRYNEFSVNINLEVGDYIYIFYQKETDENTNTEGERVLETGLLRVYGTEEEIKYYEA